MTFTAALVSARSEFSDDVKAAEMIGTYFIDPAAISSPTLIEKFSVLANEMGSEDITLLHEMTLRVDRDFADVFADVNELCRVHSCDPENCTDDPEATCEHARR